MKKHFLLKLIIFLLPVFVLGTCNDPVFHTISEEVEPKDPKIDGSPVNFTDYMGSVYTASGSSLWQYSSGNWIPADPPGDRIGQLASTDTYLFASCFRDKGRVISSLKRFDSTSKWIVINEDTENIFSAKNILFFKVKSSGNISYIDGNTEAAVLKLNDGSDTVISGELTGAAYDSAGRYYISTKNEIYFSDDISTGQMTAARITAITAGTLQFMAMINLEDSNNTIAVITSSGKLYHNNPDKDTFTEAENISMGDRTAKSSFAIWKDPNDSSQRLLLAGKQDNGASAAGHGYMEIQYNDDGSFIGNFREPGLGYPSTIGYVDTDTHHYYSTHERYLSTIAKNPVNHIFQAPDGVVFASTQQKGVWSYRERPNSGWQWNAED